MSYEQIRQFFIWAAFLNIGLLFVSVLIQMVLRRQLVYLMKLVFGIEREQTLILISGAIVFQKIVTYLFFLVPALVLWFN